MRQFGKAKSPHAAFPVSEWMGGDSSGAGEFQKPARSYGEKFRSAGGVYERFKRYFGDHCKPPTV